MLGAWQHIAEFALERLGQTATGLAEAVARDFAAPRRATMRLFPEALESLAELWRRDVLLALVTNGDGLQSRDFTHVRNVVAANCLAEGCLGYRVVIGFEAGLRDTLEAAQCEALCAGR